MNPLIKVALLLSLSVGGVIAFGGILKLDPKTQQTLIDTYIKNKKLPDWAFVKYSLTNAFAFGAMPEEKPESE